MKILKACNDKALAIYLDMSYAKIVTFLLGTSK